LGQSVGVAEDEIKTLSKMVVDFNRERGVLDDSDLLELVICAYKAGRGAEREDWHAVLTPKGIVN
jgi:hypothetical protein